MQIKIFKYIPVFFFFIFVFNYSANAQSNDASKTALRFADSVYQLKEYENAKSAYEYAARFQSNNAHIQSRLNEINRILDQQKSIENQYTTAVDAAKKALYSNDLSSATKFLKQAVSIKSDPNSWANQKLKEIENEAAAKEKLQKDFDEQMTLGNNFVSSKKYEDAVTAYTAALKLIPNEATATQKLSDAKKSIIDRDTKYKQHISEGDRLYKIDNIDDAISEYQQALALKPFESYPQQRIDFITSMKTEESDLEKKVQNIVQEADQLFSAKKYEDAYSKYQAAIDVYPGHKHSKDRVVEINGIIGEKLKTKLEYDQLIKDADQLFSMEKYTEAKQKYENALAKISTETYPNQKIKEINAILAKEKSDVDEFTRLVVSGDNQFLKEQFESAKTNYEQALKIRPNDNDVKQKLTNTTAQIAKIDKQYATLLTTAENQFKQNKLIDAQVSYEAASALKPNEALPKEKLKEIANILKDQKELLEKSYADALIEGNSFMQQNDFVNAKTAYTKASSIKPKEQEPKDKLAAVEQAIANQKEIDAQFVAFIKDGDSKFSSKRWEEALTAYQSALALKNDESINTKIANCQTEISKAKSLEDQFNQLVADGDKSFNAKDWNNAKSSYQDAMQIKSDKSLTDKIKEIDATLLKEASLDKQYQSHFASGEVSLKAKLWQDAIDNFNNALKAKPTDELATEKLNYATEQLRIGQKAEEDFQSYIVQGDNAMKTNQLDEAKTAYENALKIKQKAEYPTSQIALIVAKQKEQTQMLTNYQQFISSVEDAMQQKNWTKAQTDCQKAQQIFPNESRPKELLTTINAEIAKIEKTNQLYNEAITQAQDAFKNNNKESAIQFYQKASEIKPEEDLPKNKIKEINNLILTEKNREIENKYNALISEATIFIGNRSYEKAIAKYKEALTVKPEDEFATNKIAETQATIQKLAQIEADYAEYIKSGDANFNSKNYEAAVTSYESASLLKPNETYPKEQITKTQYHINYSPEKRQAMSKEFVNKGINEMNNNDFQAASVSFATASRWYPENTSEVQTALNTMNEKLMSGKSKVILSTKTTINSNTSHNIKTFVGSGELYAKAYIILKISGTFDKNINIFVRFGRYSITYGNVIFQTVANANVSYYCMLMKGDGNDINWMTIMPENSDITIDEVILVSPK